MSIVSVHDEGHHRFEIRPNRSMSWRAVKLFYAGMVSVSLIIAGGFAALGFWPVLPFAGLELLALGWALYACAQDSERREIVSVDSDSVAVEKGRRLRESSFEFVRAWTSVALAAPPIAWYPSRLVLRSHGREIEVGGFLTEAERTQLAIDLKRAIVYRSQ